MSIPLDSSIDSNKTIRRDSKTSSNSTGSLSTEDESIILPKKGTSRIIGSGVKRSISNKSTNAANEISDPPPLTGTFLARFISSFKNTPTSKTRPGLNRSLSTPNNAGSFRRNPSLPPDQVSSLGLIVQNASASSSTASLSRFRPSFKRRSTTATTAAEYASSDDASGFSSPMHSPLSIDSDNAFTINNATSREESRDQVGPELSDTGSGRTQRVHRGSISSQHTTTHPTFVDGVQTSGSYNTSSPLGRHNGGPIFSTTPAHYPDSNHQPLENPLSLIATLLPPALLLLSHLGPSHLFSPPIATTHLSPLLAPLLSPNILSSSDRDSIISSTASTTSSLPTGILRLNTSPAYTHELQAPSTISIPAVSAAAIWRLFRGFEWIGEVGKNGFKSVLLDTDEDDKVFDFPAVLQGVADVLAADAASRGVELVIGCESMNPPSPTRTSPVKEFPSKEPHRETAEKELLVRADERGWGVLLIWIIHHILNGAQSGSMVEVKFLASLASEPPAYAAESAGDSQGTVLPTRRLLEKWWNVTLEIRYTSQPTRSPFDKSTALPSPLSPPFFSPFAKSFFSYLDIIMSDGGNVDGTQTWILTAPLPGARVTVEDSAEAASLLNRRRASLGAPGHEPTLEDLNRFLETVLKGTRVALHSGEQSTFARYLTTFLAGWGMDVHHISLEGEEDHVAPSHDITNTPIERGGGGNEWSKSRPLPNRFDTGFGNANAEASTSDPGHNANSPASSPSASASGSGTDGPTNLVIIDDDIATLRKMLLAFRAPPLHYAPTLMNKRPQLASRRTRSSPHIRQAQPFPNLTPGLVIVHFASLTHYKVIKEIVQDALATSRSASLPDVLVIPKPAGPRRILTALWTAMKRPPVDPSLSPIATSPTSPGIQYWTPRLSPALVSGQDFDSAAAEVLANRAADQSSSGGGGSNKVRTPPIYFSGTPVGHPPSPLRQMDDQVSYFSCVAEEMDSTAASEGMVIQSPDGRPGIFFHPQIKSSRSSSGKDKEKVLVDGIEGSISTPPAIVTARGHVAAPHEIGLGQPRRTTSHSSTSSSTDSPVPVGTPALTLDSFITAAKTKSASPENSSPEDSKFPIDSKFPNEGTFLPRRTSSIISLGARSGVGSPRATATPPYPAIRRGLSGGNTSPPISPRPMSPSPAVATSPGVSFRDAPGLTSSVSFRKISSNSSSPGGRSRRGTIRKTHLPTVPPINVLIVEDNPINQTILSMFMKKKGIKYSVAKDGEEAVQKWKAGDFHLVLMDIQLPVKSGIEATREIREMERANNIGTFITTPTSDATSPTSGSSSSNNNTPTSPLLSMPVIIVALTASSLQIDRVTALAAGCNDFLTKPVSLPWLQQKLLEWGSMAYLSGFSRREGSDLGNNPNSRIENFSSGLGSTTRKTAEEISAHLYIDPKQVKTQSSTPNIPPPKNLIPELQVTSATPRIDSGETIPQVVQIPEHLNEPMPESMMSNEDLDLEGVDHKLKDLVLSASASIRPGPSPLSRPVVPSNTTEGMSLESVAQEGVRLALMNRSRADSISSVMDSSEPSSLQHSPDLDS